MWHVFRDVACFAVSRELEGNPETLPAPHKTYMFRAPYYDFHALLHQKVGIWVSRYFLRPRPSCKSPPTVLELKNSRVVQDLAV